LIEWVTANSQNRRTAWSDIPALLSWQCSLKAIRSAFKKEGYVRRIARRKPPISEENRILRLQWAIEHRDWTDEQWDEICWSDESWVQPGTHKKQRVTRKIGLSEVYHPDCVVTKYQRNIGWMFWGSISGKYGKGLGIFWEKSWGHINRFSYSERIIIPLCEYLQQHPGLQFQQDNGPGHAAKYTKEQFITHGITSIWWPPFSPDLSPIEKVWDRLKEIIEKKDPTIHRNYNRLRAAVIEAWESITDKEIRDIIREMPERCQAVIDANGMYTKW
jgi:transposase